ncbi:MAG: nucleotide exchange factor GrpE [Micromonosporaceae bacterium]|nr:nucleotide exchange factor GrpE [Micromonosporaceae bacterium]
MKARRQRRGRDQEAPPAPVPVPEQGVELAEPAPPYDAASADAADRATLIRACIYLRDRITSTALAQRLDQALEEVGVVTLQPVGEPFDPTWQEAAGVEPTQDPAHVGTVAMVETPGYADRGVLLRAPVVTVYQAAANIEGRPT